MTTPEKNLQDEIRQILQGPPGQASAALVRKAEEAARSLARDRGGPGDTGKAQLRAVFDEVRQIEALWLSDEQRALHRLHLLKPKLAYRKARAPGVAPLADLLIPAIDIATEAPSPSQVRERFSRLVELCEAVLAYYTAFSAEGGRR